MKRKQVLSMLMLTGLCLLAACSGSKKPDPGTPDPELKSTPLQFFGSSLHDEEGYTFDGFPLTADYEILEQRMELTDVEIEPRIMEYEPTSDMAGATQEVIFYQIALPDYPEAVGNVGYLFYEKQFLGGSMTIEFPDYESARDFLKEKAEELKVLNVGDPEVDDSFMELETETSYAFHCLDKRNVAIQMHAKYNAEQKGMVSIIFSEHVSRYGTENNDSIYFDFE